MKLPHFIAIAALVYGLVLSSSRAVILYRSGDPNENTTAPDTVFPHDGWDYQGKLGGVLATAVAPHYFITAAHVGDQSNVVTLGGLDYLITARFKDPASDLRLLQVAATLPFFAPLYSRTDEVGQRIVDIGRGTQRGTEVYMNAEVAGWYHGPGDGVTRWGENIVSGLYSYGAEWTFLMAEFDAAGLPDECHLSGGDSGGAAFINDDGTWKLAGINYAIEGPFYTNATGGGKFDAALFDKRGFWESVGGPPNAGLSPQPSAFFPTRISTKLAWIYSIMDPFGDLDSDGLMNLAEYAFHSEPLTPSANAAPHGGHEGNFATITYSKVVTASDITYTVQRSSDLVIWTNATTTDEVVATVGNVQTIKAKVDATGLTSLFLRLRISRP